MDIKELIQVLESSQDKFSVFLDENLFLKYNITVSNLIDIINTFLDDEEKAKLLEVVHFKRLSSSIKKEIIMAIDDDNVKLNLLKNAELMSEFEDYEIIKILKNLDNQSKVQILLEEKLLQEYNIKDYQITELIQSLDDKSKQKVLANVEIMKNVLKISQYDINKIIATFESEKTKLEMIEIYELNKYEIVDIVSTFFDESKISIILENKFQFDKSDFLNILTSLNVNSLVTFFNDNKDFFNKNNIKLYEVTRGFDNSKQIELIQYIDCFDISIEEKRKVLATLNKETKEKINTTNLPKEYVTALETRFIDSFDDIIKFGKIVVDFNQNLEIYKGLDELIYINPMQVSENDKEKLFELFEICPKIKLRDDIGLGKSTVNEYYKAENWINSVLQNLDSEWTDVQKIAFIDNAIGKKISYTPDFDTEVCDVDNARALWKIICSGYGVCNGISQVEKYMFDRIGIESEIVSSRKHVFLLLRNLEILNESGNVIKGDTILDPTWNLAAHRYGCRPNNFCLSYEEIRKNDIGNNGKDYESHKNDEKCSSATLQIDDKSLRKIFRSIGLAEKDGNFPVKQLIDKVEYINNLDLSEQEKLQRKFSQLAQYYPEFATCQNSTMAILESVILRQNKFNRCIVNRVYEKSDQEKRPVLFVFIESSDMGKKFYLVNDDKSGFIEIKQQEFEEKYECYELDIKQNNGHRYWEDKEKTNLSKSSKNIVGKEGEER